MFVIGYSVILYHILVVRFVNTKIFTTFVLLKLDKVKLFFLFKEECLMKMKIKFLALCLFTMNTTFQVFSVDDIYYSTSDAEADKVAYEKKKEERIKKLRQQALVIKSKEQQLVKAIGDTIFIEDTTIASNDFYLDTIVIVDDDDFQYTRRLNAFHDADYQVYDAANDDVNIYVVNDYGWNYPYNYYGYWGYRDWRFSWGYPYYSYYYPSWYWGHNCHYYCYHHHHHPHHPPHAKPAPDYKPSIGHRSAERFGVRNSGNRRMSATNSSSVRRGSTVGNGTRSSVATRSSSRAVVRDNAATRTRSSSSVSGSQRAVNRSSVGTSTRSRGNSSGYSSGSTRSSSRSAGYSRSYGNSSTRSSSGSYSGSRSSGSYSGSRSSGSYSGSRSSGSYSGSRSSGSSYSSGGYSSGGGRSSGYSSGGGRSSGGRR